MQVTTPRVLKVTPNYATRTFTLRFYIDGKIDTKYRTFKMDIEEFNSCLNNTNNDWKQFLKSDDYFKVNN